MKKFIIFIFMMGLLFSIVSFPAYAANYTFTNLDGYPGDPYTTFFSISGNNLVGTYNHGGNITDGFIYDGTNWTTLNAPQSWGHTTCPMSIDGNNIIGYYNPYIEGGQPYTAGCIYNGTTWTTLSYPGGTSTYLQDMSGNNMVGWYYNLLPGSIRYSFLYDGTTWSPIEYPGAITTLAKKIDGSNIIGFYKYYEDGTWKSDDFLYDGTTWSTPEYPGGKLTNLSDIEGGTIVGSYQDGSNHTHGFIFDGINWTTLDYPGAVETELHSVSGDTILGSYQATFGAPSKYFLATLGTTPPSTVPIPGALLLVGSGLIPFIRLRRKDRALK